MGVLPIAFHSTMKTISATVEKELQEKIEKGTIELKKPSIAF